LTKGVDEKTKLFDGYVAFLKEGLCRCNAKRIHIFSKNGSREDVQFVVLNSEGDDMGNDL
jgi:hypothetical protein